jgi:hypothetical protein
VEGLQIEFHDFLVHHNGVEEMFFYEKEMVIIFLFKDLIGFSAWFVQKKSIATTKLKLLVRQINE